jgi:hypothetical protein
MINNSSTLIHCICERFSAKKDVAAAFVWLHYRLEEGQECSTQKINSYFEQANLPKYNVTYLKEDLRKPVGGIKLIKDLCIKSCAYY